MTKNIVLIGMMGCGKTTVGGLLSRRLGLELADTDALIEERAGCAIRDIFRDYGEGRFRDWEWLVSRELGRREGLVVACGGGLPLQEGPMAALKQSGWVIYLDRDAGEIFDGEDLSDRPLAQNGREAFVALAGERRPVYEKWADATIHDFTSPISTAARVKEAVETLNSWEQGESKGEEQ